MFYENVFRELNKRKIRYVVVGGGAVVLHGVVRSTADLDLFVDFNEKNLLKFTEALTRLGYRPKVPVKASEFAKKSNREKWKKEKGMVVFSFYHLKRQYELIDVFIYEPLKFGSVYKNKKLIKAGRINVPIISIKDLKNLKKIAGRPQDLADIEALKDVERLRKNEKKKR
ncbi:MAG: hypothetical protein KJ706_09700 [Candidatus Omnitrophica bacterium]|nr:hypothetical protein [Candidatus Omnitrophota bacterium]MBU4590418.1 hypothetical protein [Candidatus Omnitrophota bacterium]